MMRRWILYFIFIFAATVFFLYLLFPAEAVKDLVAAQVKKTNPDYGIAVDRIQPVFPPGLKFQTMEIFYKDDLWAELEHVKVVPDYLSIFLPEKSIHFSGHAYKGEVQGRLEVTKHSEDYRYSVEANVFDIQIEDIQRLQEVSGRKISGVLDAVFRINTIKGAEREVAIRLSLSDCEIELTNPLIGLSLDHILFKHVDAELTIGKESLQLTQCKAAGSQVDGNLTGTILFKDPIGKSILSLRGTIKPHHNLLASVKKFLPGNLFQQKGTEDKGFPIKLYGTIEKPRFSLR